MIGNKLGKTNWRSFEEARAYARQLQLKNQTEWRHWAKTEAKPDDIPAQPAHVYKGKGWSSWGEWFGTDYVANQNRTYLPYAEARTYVHQLQLKNGKEWADWAKSKDKPDNIPASPSDVYKDNGWQGMGDWLGNGKIANQNRIYLPYEEALKFVHRLGLKGQGEWAVWSKTKDKPDNIPANPAQVYKKSDEWKGWGDWLGTGTVASYNRTFRPFEDARAFVHQLQLKNKDEWRNWTKTEAKPDDIPANPPRTYKDNGWQGWGDWLGTGKIANQNRVYLPYEEARAFVHSLQIKGETQWRNWLKDDNKPEDIPAQPSHVYKDKGWTGWGDWLGTGTIASYNRVFRSFEEARDFVHQLQLKNKDEWVDWAKTEAKPDDIPANPPSSYKDKGWLGWGDWIGTDSIANQNRIFLPFEEARAFVHQLNLKNWKEWNIWSKSDKKPDNISSNPSRTYKDKGWNSFGDWLGTGTIAPQNRDFLLYEEARTFVRQLQIRSGKEWSNWLKSGEKPDNIPANPAGVYKGKGWLGWGDWLGIVNLWLPNSILSFLYSLKPILSNLESSELYAIMRQNGMIASIRPVGK